MMYAIFDKADQTIVGFVDTISDALKEKYLFKEISPTQQNLAMWRWVGDYTSGSMVDSSHNPENQAAPTQPIDLEALKIKDPSLKFRYINGFGDLVAWILHAPPMSWVVKWITGKINPCRKCSARIKALNVLIPLPIWKCFFKTEEDVNLSVFEEHVRINKRIAQILAT
jgi:hypothetical protein